RPPGGASRRQTPGAGAGRGPASTVRTCPRYGTGSGPMTDVLVVNAGSSSLKLTVLDSGDAVTAGLTLDHWDGTPGAPGLQPFLERLTGIGVAGHRIVHGGSRFTRPAWIDENVVKGIGDLTDLAPLHQPRAMAGSHAAPAALP